jgi:hypothetical protein
VRRSVRSGTRGVGLVFTALALSALVSCSADGSGDGGGSASPSRGGTATTSRRTGPPPTEAPGGPGWDDVEAAVAAGTGRIERKLATVLPKQLRDLPQAEPLKISTTTTIDFDQAAGLVRNETTSRQSGREIGPIVNLLDGDRLLLSVAWVPERCGTEWAAYPPDTFADLGMDYTVETAFPQDPLTALGDADHDLVRASADRAVFRVTLPRVLLVATAGTLSQKDPEAFQDLEESTVDATLTVERSGDLAIQADVPMVELPLPGLEDLGGVPHGDEVMMHGSWEITGLGAPIDIEVPTDIADPSCFEDS